VNIHRGPAGEVFAKDGDAVAVTVGGVAAERVQALVPGDQLNVDAPGSRSGSISPDGCTSSRLTMSRDSVTIRDTTREDAPLSARR
jgi:hypothetical protein